MKEKQNPASGAIPVGPGISGDFLFFSPETDTKTTENERETIKNDPSSRESVRRSANRESEYAFICLLMEP